MASAVKKPKGRAVGAPRRSTTRLALKAGRHLIANRLPSGSETLREVAERVREAGSPAVAVAERVRSVPIQRSIDVAVPLEVAYDEWMQLDFLPEGTHRVEEIERDGDEFLVGRLGGKRRDGDWEAEIRDQRIDESFAWRSVAGSDCAGLVTFHRLGPRLTRLELQLDVVPVRTGQAMQLMLHLADRRAEADLRRFKARLETINPDDYPPLEGPADDGERADDDKEE
jgi:uncharacterized membrane protein